MPSVAFNVEIIAIGKLKSSSPLHVLYEDYKKRLNGKLSLIELQGADQKDELKKIREKLDPKAALICLDEKGQTLGSVELSKKLEKLQINNDQLQFVIGGADGLNDEIRQKADLILSFGKQTWPHMLARIMLVEQIYRAQQILANHPYHRE